MNKAGHMTAFDKELCHTHPLNLCQFATHQHPNARFSRLPVTPASLPCYVLCNSSLNPFPPTITRSPPTTTTKSKTRHPPKPHFMRQAHIRHLTLLAAYTVHTSQPTRRLHLCTTHPPSRSVAAHTGSTRMPSSSRSPTPTSSRSTSVVSPCHPPWVSTSSCPGQHQAH